MTKSKKTAYILTTTAAITVAALLLLKKCDDNSSGITSTPTAAYIQPVAGAVQEYTSFVRHAGRDTVFVHPASGTRITVPGCTEFYTSDEISQETVRLDYGYFGSAADILMAGIPMQLSENSPEFLASDGMMELLAYSLSGVPAQPAGNCPLQVEWPATDTAHSYNLYKLDTNARRWKELLGDVKALFKNSPGNASKLSAPDYEKMARTEGVSVPVKPVIKNKNRFSFNFKTDLSQLPELNVYDGVYWEYAGNKASEDPDKNPWVKTAIWDEMNISPAGKKGIYTLKLTRAGQSFITTVRPVFDAADLEYAQEIYDEKYKKYSAYVAKKKEEHRQRIAEAERRTKVKEANNEVNRSFAVNEMGFWNIDRVIKEETNLLANVKFETGKEPVTPEHVYLIPGGMRSAVYFTVTGPQVEELRWLKSGTNLLLIIDRNGNLLKAEQKELNEALATGSSIIQTQPAGVATAQKIAEITGALQTRL